MTDLNQPGVLSPIDRARLSAELLKLRDSLAGTGLSPIARVQASAQALAIRGQLGAAVPVSEGQAAFEKARQFYQENLKGQLIQSVVGPVSVNSTGWKKSKQGMKSDVLKARLIEHVRDILQTGTAGQRQEPHKERNDSFVAFYFIQKQVRVDDLLVTAGVTVAEDDKGNLFYSISHAGRDSWQAKKNGAPDYAGVGPRSGDTADGMLDGLPQVQEPSAVGDTVADDDINITILAVVAVDPNAPAANDDKPELARNIDQATIDRALADSSAVSDAEITAFIERLKTNIAALEKAGMTGSVLAQLESRLDDMELYQGWKAGVVTLVNTVADAETEAGTESDSGTQTVEAVGLSIRVPLISKALEADYNRATHMGKGRDINAELATSIRDLLTDLAGKKHTLDTPEQKAEAVMLVELYAKRSATNARQEFAAGARNPSWFVTGRGGRNMGKAYAAAQRQSDRSLEAYKSLEAFRTSIAKTLYSMRPAEVKQSQALSADLRSVAEYAGMFAGYVENKQLTLASDARKWASPKALKLIERALAIDPDGTREALKTIEAQVIDQGGMVALFGARSGVGKLLAQLLAANPESLPDPTPEPVTTGPLVITAETPDATIEGASDEQLQAKLLAVAKDFYRGLSHATKDIARRLEKGTYDRADAIKALKQNRDYLIERAQASAEWDTDMMARMGRQYGDKSVAELESIYEGMGGEIRSTQSDREMNGGGRRTGPAVANEAARQMGQHRLELGIYIKARKEAEPAQVPTENLADEYAAKVVGFKTFSEYAASRIDKLPLEAFQVARAKYKIVEYLEQHGRSDRNTLGSLTLQGANKEGPSALAQLRQDGYVLNNLRAQSDPFSLAPGVTLATFVIGDAKPVALSDQGRAPAGGTIGMNGEFYKGGTILPTTTLPKGATTSTTTGTGTQLVEPGVLAEPPEVGAVPVYGSRREFLVLQDGVMVADESKKDAMVFAYGKEGPAKVRAYAREYNAGRRWILPGEKIEPTEADQDPAPPAQNYEIIEYTTKRDKVLRGIIRMDLTLAEAKAIDPYTWRMNGGYFIREKHLSGDTSAIQAAPAPTMLTPEQEAEKQERDTRAALERQQQAIASQVGKLREAGDKAIASGTESMNADRKTNTSRRAGMAASAYARAAADEADGKTLNSIADSIEVGAAGPLANLTSRTQLQELKSALSRAKYETEKGLTYSDRLSLQGKPVDAEAIQHVSMPSRMVWSNRYSNAAMTLAKKAPTGNSKLIAALKKLGDRTERWALVNDGDIAITRKAYQVLGTVKETWDLKDPMEMLARIERLKRMGITTDAQLQDACRALLPHLAAKKEESAVVKAERAIIGQKVGIDFFPTPAAEAQRMARKARISKGKRVLEPSAGNGNLADAAAAEGAEVDVIEISSQLREILTLKGYNVVAHDFNTFTPDEKYDAILMNPPFSKRQDAEHIMRAYGMLAGGGTLVAIAGEGVFFGTDQKAVQFRDWLDSHNAEVEKLAGGTFQDNALLAQTSVSARMIVLHK